MRYLPEWMEKFADNLEDTKVPALANTSHDSDSERPTKVATRTHSIYIHFSKDRNCEACKRTKMTRAPCRRRNGEAVPPAHITKSSMRVNLGTITDTQSWYKIQPLSGISLNRAKQKPHRRRKRSSRNFLEPSEKPKVIYTDCSLEFGKSCEHLPWNHRTSTHQRFETSDIVERAVRRIKEGTSAAVLLQSGLDEKWWAVYGMLLLSGKMFKTSWQTGKHQMKGDSENHLKAELFRLEQRLNIIRLLQKDQSRLHTYCKKVLLGIFLGHVLFAGGT